MPVPSPFHARTAPLCRSFRWKDWGGYAAVASFDVDPIYEYTAFRQSCGVIDVTPLFKYDIRGKDAAAFLSRATVKDCAGMKPGQVAYTCWCDDRGKLVDDGTITCIDQEHFVLTAAEPMYFWFSQLLRGYDVELDDVTKTTAALAVQGPTSRDVLAQASDADMGALKFFRSIDAHIDTKPVRISRTGYTGDLGYEVWMDSQDALAVWDALFDAGRSYDIHPAGLDALDVVRIEAGFIMAGVDYHSAPHVTIDALRSTPYEVGLGWCIDAKRPGAYLGREALMAEKKRGPAWSLVGLILDWDEIEQLYQSYDLPPGLPAGASRETLPVYVDEMQVGQVTSSAWSPLLKQYLALACVRAPYATVGTALQVEHTPVYERRSVTARVSKRPFFDPARKRKP